MRLRSRHWERASELAFQFMRSRAALEIPCKCGPSHLQSAEQADRDTHVASALILPYFKSNTTVSVYLQQSVCIGHYSHLGVAREMQLSMVLFKEMTKMVAKLWISLILYHQIAEDGLVKDDPFLTSVNMETNSTEIGQIHTSIVKLWHLESRCSNSLSH